MLSGQSDMTQVDKKPVTQYIKTFAYEAAIEIQRFQNSFIKTKNYRRS